MISHRGHGLFWLSRREVRRKGLCKAFISTHQCMQLSSLIIMWRLYLCSVFHYGRTFLFLFLFLLLANINELRNNGLFILYIMLDLFIFCIPFVLYFFSFFRFVLFFFSFFFFTACVSGFSQRCTEWQYASLQSVKSTFFSSLLCQCTGVVFNDKYE